MPFYKVSCPACGDDDFHTANNDDHSLEVHNTVRASRHKEFEEHMAKYKGEEKKD
jgi:hypothetical protein